MFWILPGLWVGAPDFKHRGSVSDREPVLTAQFDLYPVKTRVPYLEVHIEGDIEIDTDS